MVFYYAVFQVVIEKEALDFKFPPRGVSCGREGQWRQRTLGKMNLPLTQDPLGLEPLTLTLGNSKLKE